jgi:hypothetical protein
MLPPRMLLLLLLCAVHADAFYTSHMFRFPAIPYSAGIHHIHSPQYFMEAHGFALPGFEMVETKSPQAIGEYVTAEFSYRTYFCDRMTGRVFSSALNTSHVLLLDPDGVPCLLGWLSIDKCSANGLLVRAHADLLRPSNIWERLLGGKRLVKECEVERAIKLGYSNFKGSMDMKAYMNLVTECSKRRDSK